MSIQEFDCEIFHIPGKLNVVADGFSRLLSIQEEQLNAYYDFHIPVHIKEDIRKVHNSVSGHHGVERTLSKLDALGLNWLYRREHVKKFLKQCPFCQKMSYLKTPIHTHPFTTAAYYPMERLGMDSIQSLPESAEGYRYILVIICCFTRWVELYPLKYLTMEATAKVVLQHFGRFGQPAQVIHDNGTQFVNGTFEEMIQLTGIQQIPILAYSSEENAIVERANKEVMRHLRAIIYDKNIIKDWESYLPMVQRIINAAKNESNGVSSDQLLFGNSIQLDRGIFLPLREQHEAQISLSNWASKMLTAQRDVMKIAQRIQLQRDQEHMAKADPRRTEYAVGSYVLVQYHAGLKDGPPNKFLTNLRGPMRVKSVDSNTYTLENLLTRKNERIHVTDIKPYDYDATESDPADVARRDSVTATAVDSILEHAGDKKLRSQLDFKVRWANLGPEDDLWLPYKELRDNDKLHAYLLANDMGNLVPIKFRVGVTIPKKPLKKANRLAGKGSSSKKSKNKTNKK
jgi:transposase InsO family protein